MVRSLRKSVVNQSGRTSKEEVRNGNGTTVRRLERSNKVLTVALVMFCVCFVCCGLD